jgi:hypothetical protein
MTTEPYSEHNNIIAWSHNDRIPATIRRRVTYHTLADAGWVRCMRAIGHVINPKRLNRYGVPRRQISRADQSAMAHTK